MPHLVLHKKKHDLLSRRKYNFIQYESTKTLLLLKDKSEYTEKSERKKRKEKFVFK